MTLNQIFDNIFGTEPKKLVRTQDPLTSYEAAEKVDTTKLEKMVYEAIRSFPNGCISDEILRLFPTYPYSSITARYKALSEKDLIGFNGTRTGRSGRQQRIMKATNVLR
jgi:hypothetical protein